MKGTVTGGIQRKAGVIAGHEPCGVVAAVGSPSPRRKHASASA
jgi:threonine dehydrogenase-like Zn-dependent dehydrogenase